MDKCFSVNFCSVKGIKPDKYEQAAFNEALYFHAKLLIGLFSILWPGYCTADYEFIRNVGKLKRYRDFSHEAEEYAHHPSNQGFWRKVMNVRVSSKKLRNLVKTTLHPKLGAEPDAE